MSGIKQLAKLRTGNSDTDRAVAHIADTLNPVLRTLPIPADFRFAEVAGLNGAAPTFQLQYKANNAQGWAGIATFDSSGSLVSGSVPTSRLTGTLTSGKIALGSKGVLLSAPGAGAAQELAVGADGQVLTADSTQALGIKWAAGGGGGGSSTPSYFTPTFRRLMAWLAATNNSPGSAIATLLNTSAPAGYGAGSQQSFAGADRFWMQFVLGAGANSSSGAWWGGGATQIWTRLAYKPKLASRVRLNALAGVQNLGLSLCGASGGSQASSLTYVPTLGGTNADTATFAQLSTDSRVNGNWLIGTGDGATASWVDTGVVATTTDDWLLTIDYSAGGASVAFTVTNCTTGVSTTVNKSTNLPAAAASLGPNIGSVNIAGGAVAGEYVEYVYMETT